MSEETSETLLSVRGQILSYNKETHQIVISGDDGIRYISEYSEWKERFQPERGAKVDFTIMENKVIDIYQVSSNLKSSVIIWLFKSYPYFSLLLFIISFYLYFNVDVKQIEGHTLTVSELHKQIPVIQDRTHIEHKVEGNLAAPFVIGLGGIAILVTFILIFSKQKSIRSSSISFSSIILMFYSGISGNARLHTDGDPNNLVQFIGPPIHIYTQTLSGYSLVFYLLVFHLLYSVAIYYFGRKKQL